MKPGNYLMKQIKLQSNLDPKRDNRKLMMEMSIDHLCYKMNIKASNKAFTRKEAKEDVSSSNISTTSTKRLDRIQQTFPST